MKTTPQNWVIILPSISSAVTWKLISSINTSCLHFLPKSHLPLSLYFPPVLQRKCSVLVEFRAKKNLFFLYLCFFTKLLIMFVFEELKLIPLVSLYVSPDNVYFIFNMYLIRRSSSRLKWSYFKSGSHNNVISVIRQIKCLARSELNINGIVKP